MQIDTIETAGAEVARANFTMSPADLSAAATFLAKRVIESNNPVPILSTIRIEAGLDGRIELVATDLDICATLTLSGDVQSPGAVCVDAAVFADVLAKVRKGGSGFVTIEDGGGRVAVKSGRTRAFVPTMPAADFPVRLGTPTDEAPLSRFTVPAAQFVQDLAALSPCQSKEEVRHYLRGVMIEARELAGRERLVMVATDGRNIAAASRAAPEGLEPFGQAILPSRTVAALIAAGKLFSDADAVQVEPGARFAFTIGAVRIEAKLIAGTFPEWERVFAAGSLAPTDGDACLFPDLLPGAPVAMLEKLAKGVKGAIDWQPATRGLIGTVPGDDGLIFGAMAMAGGGCDKRDMAYQWSGQDDARSYLTALAESAGLPSAADMAARCAAFVPDDGRDTESHWGSAYSHGAQLIMDGGTVRGLTVSGRYDTYGWRETVQDWEALAFRHIDHAGEVGAIEGSYSIVMPRERAQLEPESFIDGPDGHRYAVAMGDKAIAFSKEQVRALIGETCFAVMEITLPSGKPAHILQWLWDQGDSRFLTVQPDGRCYGARATPVYVTRAEIEVGPVQVQPEAVALEASERAPESVAEPVAAVTGPDMPEIAPSEPEIEEIEAMCSPFKVQPDGEQYVEHLITSGRFDPDAEPGAAQPSDDAEQLPADVVTEKSHDQIDPMAELAARVAALEAMAATPLPAVSAEPPSGEAVRAKRTPAHERAVRRAWAERKARRGQQCDLTTAVTCVRAAESREQQALDQLDNARSSVERWKGEAEAAEARAIERNDAYRAEREIANVAMKRESMFRAKRLRAVTLARYRGKEMSLMAKMMRNLHAKLQAAQLAPRYTDEAGREGLDLVSREASRAFEQRDRAEAAEQSARISSAAVGRQQEAIERMADAMEAATLRAIRAETALAAIKARESGWPPAVQSVSVNFAA